MWYNVILDFLIVSDVSGVVYLIENTLYYTLKNNLKVPIRSDKKLPLFSLSYSYRTSGNYVSALTSETHVKKENSSPETKKSYFSFGFFGSKSDESSETPVQNTEDANSKEESKSDSNKQPPPAKTRVKVNKSDILSGNFNASKPSEPEQKQTKDKSKVDPNKIDEILKRIERQTGKAGSAKEEKKQEKQSIGQLISELKQDAQKNEEVKDANAAANLPKTEETLDLGDKKEPVENEDEAI